MNNINDEFFEFVTLYNCMNDSIVDPNKLVLLGTDEEIAHYFADRNDGTLYYFSLEHIAEFMEEHNKEFPQHRKHYVGIVRNFIEVKEFKKIKDFKYAFKHEKAILTFLSMEDENEKIFYYPDLGIVMHNGETIEVSPYE